MQTEKTTMGMVKKWKECGVCGYETYRIKSDSTLICAGCGTMVGHYHDGEVPPSYILNEPELKAAYMDVFEGGQPTKHELRIIEREVGNDFSRIAEEIQAAVERLKEKGKLPAKLTMDEFEQDNHIIGDNCPDCGNLVSVKHKETGKLHCNNCFRER